MRLAPITVGLAACANLVSGMAFTAPARCLTMKDTAEKLDVNRWIDLWLETTCKRCQSPKLSDYRTLRESHVAPFVKDCSDSMGTSHLSSNYLSLLDNLLDLAKSKCEVTDETDMCEDPDQLKTVAKCVQSNAWSFILGNVGNFLPILLADPCGKQMDFIANPDTLDRTIRSHLANYEKTCPKNSESLGQ